MKTRKTLLGATLLALATVCTGALAQDHADHGPGGRGPGGPGGAPGRQHGPVELDARYHHDHYYPPRGYAYGTLPYGALSVGYAGGNYFFHGGVWFRPVGGRYVVVTPPIGIFAPVLPPDVVTLWIGGMPYYYADGVYYNVAPGQGYVVVAPPPGAEVAQPTPAPVAAAPDPIFYPRNNQSATQTEADRRDCNSWATTQPKAMADAKVFQRAVEACMDGRGYTVR
jgi:hypothetical protein